MEAMANAVQWFMMIYSALPIKKIVVFIDFPIAER